MERIKLTTLRSRLAPRSLRLERRRINEGASNAYDMLALIDTYGRIIFTVAVDDLFDADGNRFEDDLP